MYSKLNPLVALLQNIKTKDIFKGLKLKNILQKWMSYNNVQVRSCKNLAFVTRKLDFAACD